MPDDRTTAEERRKRKREKGGFVARLSVKVAPARSLGLPAIAENNGMARRLRRSRVNRTDIIGNILPQNGKTPSMRRISILQQFAGKWDSPFQNSSPRIWKAASGGPSSPRDTDEWEIAERIQESVKTAFWGKKKTHLACRHSAAPASPARARAQWPFAESLEFRLWRSGDFHLSLQWTTMFSKYHVNQMAVYEGLAGM